MFTALRFLDFRESINIFIFVDCGFNTPFEPPPGVGMCAVRHRLYDIFCCCTYWDWLTERLENRFPSNPLYLQT